MQPKKGNIRPAPRHRGSAALARASYFYYPQFRHIPVTLALPGQERFQMPGNHSIQRIFCGIAGPIDVLDGHEDIAECKLLRICPANENSKLQGKVGEKSR